MKLRGILFFIALLASSISGFGQGGQRISTALQALKGSDFAQIIPNAKVSVCSYNSNLNCVTPIPIFYDEALTKPITQPLIADLQGVYSYYINAGTQLVEQVCAPFNQCKTYGILVSGGSGGGSSFPGCTSPSTGNLTCIGTITGNNLASASSLNTNTGVSILGYTQGSNYSSASITLSGGTCSVSPVMVPWIDVHTGSVYPILLNPGNCSVSPTATISGSTVGSTASVTIGLQSNVATLSNTGTVQSNPSTGNGPLVSVRGSYIQNPLLYSPVLAIDTADGDVEANLLVNCPGNANVASLLSVNSASIVKMSNQCVGDIYFYPQGSTASFPGAQIIMGSATQNGQAAGTILQLNQFLQVPLYQNGITFSPSFSSTISLPETAGLNFHLTSSGAPLAVGILGGGTGYSGTGTCVLAGGTLISGGADTCSAAVTGGNVVVTITGAGIYSMPPLLTITGISGGANATLSGFPRLAGGLTATGSIAMDPSGTLHVASTDFGPSSTDYLTITKAGGLTLAGAGCVSGSYVKGDGSGCSTPAGGGTVIGTGTTNKYALWTSTSGLGNGHLDDGLTVASTITSSEALSVNVNGGTALPTDPSNTTLEAANTSGNATRILATSFGGAGYFSTRIYGGTLASPTAVSSGTEIGGFNAFAYNGTGLNGPIGAFRVYANQTQTGSAGGTYADIATTPNGTTSEAEVVRFNSDGGITVPSTVTGGDKGAGTINAAGLYVNGVAVGSGGSGTPGGSNTQLQYNASGSFGGISNATYNSANSSLSLANQNNLSLYATSPPLTPMSTAASGTGVLTGAYYYNLTCVTPQGEGFATTAGTSGTLVNPSSQQVSLTSIPTCGDATTTARNIYRTTANGIIYNAYLLHQIADNTTTTYTDNTPDGSLGVIIPWASVSTSIFTNPALASSIPNSSGTFFQQGYNTLTFGFNSGGIPGYANTSVSPNSMSACNGCIRSTAVGLFSLYTLTTGQGDSGFGVHSCDGVTTGGGNDCFGYASGQGIGAGNNNLAMMAGAMGVGSSPSNSIAIGVNSQSVSTAANNTSGGYGSLQFNSTGTSIAVWGYEGFQANTTGNDLWGGGALAGQNNIDGNRLTLTGYSAGSSNQHGSSISAYGVFACLTCTAGPNDAFGDSALSATTSGIQNAAFADGSLNSNTTGLDHTATGFRSLFSELTATGDTANGWEALYNLTTGGFNFGGGYTAGKFVGGSSTPNQTSLDSVYVGANTQALADGDTNEGVYGYGTIGHGNNTQTLGNTSTTDTYLVGILHDVSIAGSSTYCLQINSSGVISNAGLGCNVSLQVNSVNNTSQALMNAETSTANSVGLTVTPSNPSGGIVKWEITGSSYTGNAATSTLATNATNVGTTGGVTTNSTFYIPFVASNTSGNQGLNTSAGITYNPSTGVTTFGGSGTSTVTTDLIVAGLIYSAGGTALPTCNSGAKGTYATVSDATLPTYLGTYSSGGSVVAPVLCNGTNWVTY